MFLREGKKQLRFNLCKIKQVICPEVLGSYKYDADLSWMSFVLVMKGQIPTTVLSWCWCMSLLIYSDLSIMQIQICDVLCSRRISALGRSCVSAFWQFHNLVWASGIYISMLSALSVAEFCRTEAARLAAIKRLRAS